MKRYEQRDRKNYLVALIFEELLKSGSIGEFEFDVVRLARKIGLKDIRTQYVRRRYILRRQRHLRIYWRLST